MTYYGKHIARVVPEYDPRHVEAYMRLEYGTLDHLDGPSFEREARLAAEYVAAGGTTDAEALARSYGL